MVPAALVTSTLAVPALPAGVVQVNDVVDVTEGDVQVLTPILTVVAPATKLVPVMVTLVAPAVAPLLGLMAVTVGATT